MKVKHIRSFLFETAQHNLKHIICIASIEKASEEPNEQQSEPPSEVEISFTKEPGSKARRMPMTPSSENSSDSDARLSMNIDGGSEESSELETVKKYTSEVTAQEARNKRIGNIQCGSQRCAL